MSSEETNLGRNLGAHDDINDVVVVVVVVSLSSFLSSFNMLVRYEIAFANGIVSIKHFGNQKTYGRIRNALTI